MSWSHFAPVPKSARYMPKITEIRMPMPEPLLAALRPLIDDSMLHQIAAADYGDRVDAHFAALTEIRAQGLVPQKLDWVPGEVLELIRWSMPEDPAWAPGGQGRRGHLMRAFACAVLLTGARLAVNREHSLGYADTLIQLVGSIDALDLPLHAPAAALVDGVLVAAGLDDFGAAEAMLMLIAQLWLQLHCTPRPVAAITGTLDDMDGLLTAYAAEPGPWKKGDTPTLSDAGMKADAWRDLAQAMGLRAMPGLSATLVKRIRAAAATIADAP
jgi:hypothetical protein